MNLLSKLSLKRKISRILKANNVSYCALFGSRARNDHQAASDYDFLIDFPPQQKVSLFSLAQLKNELEDKLNRPVDLAARGRIKPSLQSRINNNLVRLYGKR